MDILALGNLNSGNVETGVSEHRNRLDWLDEYLSDTTHLSRLEPLCDWVKIDKLVLIQSPAFLGLFMPDSRDMVAGIFIKEIYRKFIDNSSEF